MRDTRCQVRVYLDNSTEPPMKQMLWLHGVLYKLAVGEVMSYNRNAALAEALRPLMTTEPAIGMFAPE